LFANASKSFKPNGGTDMAGKAFDPEEGRGYEAGVKLDLLDGRLGMTLAAFHLKKKNVLTADIVDRRAGDSSDSGFELPAYTTVDLLAHYPLASNATLGVNVNNLFDRRYYERSYNNCL
ncbi:TonB-dependent receptor domain-containing protein, partial [Pseudomonas aeruginosa]